MKKQMLLSFLAGAVVPLVLAALFQKSPALPEAESESISPPQTATASSLTPPEQEKYVASMSLPS